MRPADGDQTMVHDEHKFVLGDRSCVRRYGRDSWTLALSKLEPFPRAGRPAKTHLTLFLSLKNRLHDLKGAAVQSEEEIEELFEHSGPALNNSVVPMTTGDCVR